MSSLPLRCAVAQMLMMGFNGTTLDAGNPIIRSLTEDGLGGVLLFDKNLKKPGEPKNIVSAEQVKALNAQLRQFSAQQDLPLLIAVDYEGGAVDRLKPDYGFPETLPPEIFATLSDKAAAIEARRMATTLMQHGFNLNFAPLVDLNVYPENPIIGKKKRSFSADPETVVHYASIVAKAYHDQHIVFCYKHFPGHGSSRGDSHWGIVDVSDTWQPEECMLYQPLINHPMGCDMIMSAHVINRNMDPSGLPASLSYKILTDILRGKMGYDGVIIVDDLQMMAVTETFGFEESIVMAINAGNDMLIFGNQCGDIEYTAEEVVDVIVKNVVDNKISRERIDTALARIERLKRGC